MSREVIEEQTVKIYVTDFIDIVVRNSALKLL
jgi:hypothetical protein